MADRQAINSRRFGRDGFAKSGRADGSSPFPYPQSTHRTMPPSVWSVCTFNTALNRMHRLDGIHDKVQDDLLQLHPLPGWSEEVIELRMKIDAGFCNSTHDRQNCGSSR
jgi:hypothetical protein